jgi:hypothetical protein
MYSPSTVPSWILIIYERWQRFTEVVAGQMANDLVKACEAVGTTTPLARTVSAPHAHQA